MGVPGWEALVPQCFPRCPRGGGSSLDLQGAGSVVDALNLALQRGVRDTAPNEGPSPALRTQSQSPRPLPGPGTGCSHPG